MFIAIARIPPGPAALPKAARLTGMTLADVSRLLAGTLPRVLVRATEDGTGLARALEAEGFVAFLGPDPGIPSDQQRVVARDLELSPEALTAIDRSGQRHLCPPSAVGAYLRGVRRLETTELQTSTQRKLDLGKALLTGGLSVTKKVTTTTERTTEEKQAFLLILRNDDQPPIMLHERRLNYRCLGTGIQPSTFGNFTALLARLRSFAPAAPLDDRMTRPGFLTGLPPLSVDPADLAIFLVSQARSRGC
jgi:hypothetical protein